MDALPDTGEPIRVRTVQGGLSPVHDREESHAEWLARLAEAVGTDDTEIAQLTLRSLASGLGRSDDATLNALLAQVQEMAPRNAVERCLLIQMLLTSHKSVCTLAEGNRAANADDRAERMALAMRLMRLYLQQCETLRKLRHGGSQTVTINHNHIVTDKAVIGDVYSGRG